MDTTGQYFALLQRFSALVCVGALPASPDPLLISAGCVAEFRARRVASRGLGTASLALRSPPEIDPQGTVEASPGKPFR